MKYSVHKSVYKHADTYVFDPQVQADFSSLDYVPDTTTSAHFLLPANCVTHSINN
jgi:hypothetical protein